MPRRKAGARVLGPYYQKDRARWRVIAVGFDGRRQAPDYFSDETEARAYAARLQEALERRLTGEAIDGWEEHLRAIGKKDITIQADVCRLNNMLDRADPLAIITADYLEDRGNSYVQAGGSPNYADTMVWSARRLVKWAVKQGWMNPVDLSEIHVQGERRAGKAQLTMDEARVLLTAALLDGTPRQRRLGVAAAMALLMGLRAGEIVNRVVRDFDNQGTELRVLVKTKNKSSVRIVEIPSELQPRIAELCRGKAPDDPIISHDGQPYSRTIVRNFTHELCDLAGLPRVCAHGLRGTHATIAWERAATSHVVAAALGHTSDRMTRKHYASPDAVKTAEVRKVSERLQLVQGGKQ
jgi:integrase